MTMILQIRILFVSFFIFALCSLGFAQNAQIQGRVSDTSGAVITKALVRVVDQRTGIERKGETNGSGQYIVPGLDPSIYEVFVQAPGFSTAVSTPITLNVAQTAVLDFKLQVGQGSEVITVNAGDLSIDTTDSSVSTVIDRQFVENTPLNGRSFQSLILLTPGVATNTPQTASAQGGSGEFSVNGQRTESNIYSIDGVQAPGSPNQTGYIEAGSTGAIPASSAVGTTQALVSLDALQEFRVESSSYSAEFGRSPGGQFTFATRSGTNKWHGTAFDYLRNDALDANNFFNDYYGNAKQPLRQNDFGGTFSGPVYIPHIYNGTDKTFFFFSYEGLKLTQSQAAGQYWVPSIALRQSAPAAIQPILNSFPIPTGPALTTGLAPFVSGITLPSSIDSLSLRLDQNLSDRVKLFFRAGNVPSKSDTASSSLISNEISTSLNLQTYTLGAIAQISENATNDLRFNYSQNRGHSNYFLTSLGGAQPANYAQLAGINTQTNPTYFFGFLMSFSGDSVEPIQEVVKDEEKQWNLTDAFTYSFHSHNLKAGMDYLRLTPSGNPPDPRIAYAFISSAEVASNQSYYGSFLGQTPDYPVWNLLSLFVQDTWRVSSKLSISGGIRWEHDPPPTSATNQPPYVLTGNLAVPSSLGLAPGSLWHTTWFNFAPRLGAAYTLVSRPGCELILRGGGGVFFDTGEQDAGAAFSGAGTRTTTTVYGASLPVPSAYANPTVPYPPTAPYTNATVVAFPSHFQLPYTLHWNASLEQAFGTSQALTITYVGSAGRRLLQEQVYTLTSVNPNFGQVTQYTGGVTSDYDSLQLQYQRHLSKRIQALASYTWAHAIDYGSSNLNFAFTRGNSDYDVRHNLTAALSYDVGTYKSGTLRQLILGHWGLDGRFTARTGYPLTLLGNISTAPVNGIESYTGVNIVPNEPFFLYSPTYPGGRRINQAAFSLPGSGTGNAPRNFLRGFGATELDIALRREFQIYKTLRLQFRAEAFNVLNHPNFGFINTTYGATLFGEATQTLNQSLGTLSPLYQQGGPRSQQVSLRLAF